MPSRCCGLSMEDVLSTRVQKRRANFWNYFSTSAAFLKYVNFLLCIADLASVSSIAVKEGSSLLFILVLINCLIICVCIFLLFPLNIIYKMEEKFYKNQHFTFCQLVSVFHFLNLVTALDLLRLHFKPTDNIVVACSIIGMLLTVIDYYIYFKYGQQKQFYSLTKQLTSKEDTEPIVDAESGNYDSGAESEFDVSIAKRRNATSVRYSVVGSNNQERATGSASNRGNISIIEASGSGQREDNTPRSSTASKTISERKNQTDNDFGKNLTANEGHLAVANLAYEDCATASGGAIAATDIASGGAIAATDIASGGAIAAAAAAATTVTASGDAITAKGATDRSTLSRLEAIGSRKLVENISKLSIFSELSPYRNLPSTDQDSDKSKLLLANTKKRQDMNIIESSVASDVASGEPEP